MGNIHSEEKVQVCGKTLVLHSQSNLVLLPRCWSLNRINLIHTTSQDRYEELFHNVSDVTKFGRAVELHSAQSTSRPFWQLRGLLSSNVYKILKFESYEIDLAGRIGAGPNF